jgi:putative transposase
VQAFGQRGEFGAATLGELPGFGAQLRQPGAGCLRIGLPDDLPDMPYPTFAKRFGVERQDTGQEFVQEHPQGIDIRARVDARESLGLYAAQHITGSDVVDVLDGIIHPRDKPARIQVDNGSEFTSRAMDLWAYLNKVKLDFSRPGKPTDNPYIESFNGKFRAECLNENWFLSLADARSKIDQWREDYNRFRPHSSLADLSPAEFAGCRIASGQPTAALQQYGSDISSLKFA